MNGIIYELWKLLNQIHKESLENNDPENKTEQEKFNIIKLTTVVFNDIQKYGLSRLTNFSTGWMCPIYKKNDKNEIANYRPITILNTDYKILTKVLAL